MSEQRSDDYKHASKKILDVSMLHGQDQRLASVSQEILYALVFVVVIFSALSSGSARPL